MILHVDVSPISHECVLRFKSSCGIWWRHQVETFSRDTGPLCGEFNGHRWIPTPPTPTPHHTNTKASYAELWCFFDLRLNKQLGKQSWGLWFETPSCSLWRHCNDKWIAVAHAEVKMICQRMHESTPPTYESNINEENFLSNSDWNYWGNPVRIFLNKGNKFLAWFSNVKPRNQSG